MPKYRFIRTDSERSARVSIIFTILALLSANLGMGVLLYQHTTNPKNYTYSASEPSSAVVTSDVIVTNTGDDDEPEKYHVLVRLPSGEQYGVYVGKQEEFRPGDTLNVWTASMGSPDVFSTDVGNGSLGLYDNEDLRVSVKNFTVAEASGIRELYVYGAIFAALFVTFIANLLFLLLWRTAESKQDDWSLLRTTWRRQEDMFSTGYCALFVFSALTVVPSIGAVYSGGTGGTSGWLAAIAAFMLFIIASLPIAWISRTLPKFALRETQQPRSFGGLSHSSPKAHYNLR